MARGGMRRKRRDMKKTSARISMIVLTALLLSCCATRGIETRARITSDDFSPTRGKHRSDVEVFEISRPTRPYREVATIRAVGIDKSTKGGLVEAMQIRATKLGVDALIDLSFSSEPITLKSAATGTMDCPTMAWKECRYLGGDSVITSRPTATATAIVYTDETEPSPKNPKH